MIFTDFLLGDLGDLQISDTDPNNPLSGDFVLGPSDNQHIFDIITSATGSFKQFPILGCNIITQLKGQNANGSIPIIKQQLQSDGYSMGSVKAGIDETGNLKIEFPQGITR